MPSLRPREGKALPRLALRTLAFVVAMVDGHGGEPVRPKLLCEWSELLAFSGTMMGLDLDGLCLSRTLCKQSWKQDFELTAIYLGGDLST